MNNSSDFNCAKEKIRTELETFKSGFESMISKCEWNDDVAGILKEELLSVIREAYSRSSDIVSETDDMHCDGDEIDFTDELKEKIKEISFNIKY